jgi:site-specific DNA recombinase
MSAHRCLFALAYAAPCWVTGWAGEKRTLLNFLLSNCVWKDGKLTAEYRHPFDMLAVAVVADQQAGLGINGEKASFENWLPR